MSPYATVDKKYIKLIRSYVEHLDLNPYDDKEKLFCSLHHSFYFATMLRSHNSSLHMLLNYL